MQGWQKLVLKDIALTEQQQEFDSIKTVTFNISNFVFYTAHDLYP